MVDAKAVFQSSSDVGIKIRAVPSNVAFKFLNGKTIWCLDRDELSDIKDHIEIYISNLELEAGAGIVQYWEDIHAVTAVLSATQNQISELIKLNLNSQYIQLNIGGDEQEPYIEGSFTFSKNDYPIDSWSMELPL